MSTPLGSWREQGMLGEKEVQIEDEQSCESQGSWPLPTCLVMVSSGEVSQENAVFQTPSVRKTLNYSFSWFQLNSLTQHHWCRPVSAAGSLETSHTSAPTFLTPCLLPSWARHWAGVQKILSWWKEVYIHLKETHSTEGPNIWGMKSPLVIFIGWMLKILQGVQPHVRCCQGCMWKEEEDDPICSFWTFLERLTHITKKQEKPKNEWPHIAGRESRRSGA